MLGEGAIGSFQVDNEPVSLHYGGDALLLCYFPTRDNRRKDQIFLPGQRPYHFLEPRHETVASRAKLQTQSKEHLGLRLTKERMPSSSRQQCCEAAAQQAMEQ